MALTGTWQQFNTDNFDEYLKFVGIDESKICIIVQCPVTMHIAREGDEVSIQTVSSFTTQDLKFKIGQEFQMEMPSVSSGKYKCIASEDEHRIVTITEPVNGEGIKTTTIRELVGDELIMTMTSDNVTCKRYFRR